MVRSRNILYSKHFQGEPKEDDFTLVEEELPPLKDGEFQTEALYCSVDPYMRVYVKTLGIPLGSPMIGRQVARVIDSKHPGYKVGDVVFGNFGWRTHSNVSEKKYTEIEKLDYYQGLPYSLALGILGRPGYSAYFGLLEICKPKEGETVVVTGAAGAVGNHVGQIAKLLGCRVIGFAGSDEKVKWLTEELKFDRAYNYKTIDIDEALKEAAPNGIDCYFDNVGGPISSRILARMNQRGRIAVCGSVSVYNADPDKVPTAPYIQRSMISNQLRMEGFHVTRWINRYREAAEKNIQWIKEGKIKYRETITEGFENLPQTFIGMLRGNNTGKAIVKAKSTIE